MLREFPPPPLPTTCHMSCVTCHVSHITFHMYFLFYFFILRIFEDVLVDGLLSTGPTQFSFF